MENTRTAFLSQGEGDRSARMWPRDLQSEAQEPGDMGRSSRVREDVTSTVVISSSYSEKEKLSRKEEAAAL